MTYFLLERAKIAANNSNQTLETAIKQLAHIEASIQPYLAIKRVMNPSAYKPGLTSIQVPTDKGTYQAVTDSKEIEEHLIHRNCEHNTQAEHTVMAHHLICKISGTADFCNQLLAGTADSPNLPATLQAIFKQLHQPHSVDISELIDYNDFKDALHKWKETTSTSPSKAPRPLHKSTEKHQRRHRRNRQRDIRTTSYHAASCPTLV
jgi:hypothetical protein